MYKGVIFDFDGTLVRSQIEVYEVLRELSLEFGFYLPPAEDLRQLSTQETMRVLGVRLWQVPRFTALARRKLAARLSSIEFEPDLLELLAELRMNYQVALVSSNSAHNVRVLLERRSATALFDQIVCGSSLLGKHQNLNRTIKRLNLQPSEVLYVGDETRDVHAGRKSGVATAAVTWGYHSRPNLAAAEPSFLADTPEELRNIVKG